MKNNANKLNVSKIIKLEELNWKQIENLDKNKTIFFLPISPLEQHGPHLPVGTDLLTIKDVVNNAVKILNKKNSDFTYVVIPPIPIGYCKFNTEFPGSISVSGKVVRDVVYSVGSALGSHKFKYMVVCTFHLAVGHLRGIYSAMKKLESEFDLKTCEPWGPIYFKRDIEKREPKLGFDTSKEVHGGFRETSLMKYQYPYLVDESYKKLQSIYRDVMSPRVLGKNFKEIGLKDGYIGSPARADADYGRWFFNEIVNVFVESTIKLLKGEQQEELPNYIKVAMKALFWQ